MEKICFERSQIEVSRVGLGTLTLGKSQLGLSIEAGAELILHAVRRGINFFDTAQYYDTYAYLRAALDRLAPKEKKDIVICSKSLDRSYAGMRAAVSEARKALGRDVIDIFLLHEVRSADDLDERSGALRALEDAKKAGEVKAIGLSTHHVDVCELAANYTQLDTVFPLINFRGLGIRKGNAPAGRYEMYSAIRRCKEKGKDIFSMKAFGGGNLCGDYREALEYIFSLSEISAVMVGFSRPREIDEIDDFLSGKLAEDFAPDIRHKKIIVDQSDCEGCGSCIKRCPQGAIHFNRSGFAEVDRALCISCGYCAPVCPVRAIIML